MAELETPATKRGGRRKLYLWVGVLVAFVILTVGTLEVTSTPEFCGSCHEVEPSMIGWETSAHADVSCMKCHAGDGVLGYLATKIGGLREVYVHVTEKPENADLVGEVDVEKCLTCHEDEWEDETFVAEHPTQDAPCAACHRETFHTNARPVYPELEVAEGEELPELAYGDDLTCAQCHTDRGLLKADLEADPKAVAEKSDASEGEG